MKQSDNNIFRPNILLFTIGTILTIFFSVLLTYIIIDKSLIDKPVELLLLLVIEFIFIWLFTICIDVWTIKIDKGKIHLKRIFSAAESFGACHELRNYLYI